MNGPESLNNEALAALLYETDQRIMFGHVPVSWVDRQHGAAKQAARKRAEQILFSYDVTPKGKP